MTNSKIFKLVRNSIILLFLIALTITPFVLRILLRVGVLAPDVNILTIIGSYAPIIFLFPAMVAGAYTIEEFLPALFDLFPKEEKVCETVEEENFFYNFATDFALYRATGEVPEYR